MIAVLLCAAVARAPIQVPDAHVAVHVVTRHYDLAWEGTQVEADEAGGILEQAWTAFAAFFDPKLDAKTEPKTRFAVRVYTDESERLRGAWNDGALVPTQSSVVSFSETTRAVYVARQPSRYTTRNALIFGACLQFHALFKSKNLDITRTWYSSGLAHVFARHVWDGHTLELMAHPRVTPIDLPAQAIQRFEKDPDNVPHIGVPELLEAPLSWAAVGLCLRGEQGRYKTAFQRWALGGGGSKMSSEDFLHTLGDEKEFARALHTFLVREQAPFESIEGQWEDDGSAGISGNADVGKMSFCVLKDGGERLSASMSALPKQLASAGFVAGWWGPDDCTLVRIEAPSVVFEHRRLGRVPALGVFPMPGSAAKPHHIELVRKNADAIVTVDDNVLGQYEVGGGCLGFFVEGATVTFRDVTWH